MRGGVPFDLRHPATLVTPRQAGRHGNGGVTGPHCENFRLILPIAIWMNSVAIIRYHWEGGLGLGWGPRYPEEKFCLGYVLHLRPHAGYIG